MNGFSKIILIAAIAVAIMFMRTYHVNAVAPGPPVSHDRNKHNLSSDVYDVVRAAAGFNDPNSDRKDVNVPIGSTATPIRSGRDLSIKYKAQSDSSNSRGRQICIFCHTPHSSNSALEQTPLWNRKFSSQTFDRYSGVGTLKIKGIAEAQYGLNAQPDGASKLCLSCHDGVSSLGGVATNDLLRGGPIPMDISGGNVITGIASFKGDTNKMKFGHHPVSFVYNGVVQQAVSSAKIGLGYQLPAALSGVKLDKNKKMQCTTCHDPHQNKSDDDKCYDGGGAAVDCDATYKRKIVPFWVLHNGSNTASEDHDAVCTSCHRLVGSENIAPWP